APSVHDGVAVGGRRPTIYSGDLLSCSTTPRNGPATISQIRPLHRVRLTSETTRETPARKEPATATATPAIAMSGLFTNSTMPYRTTSPTTSCPGLNGSLGRVFARVT